MLVDFAKRLGIDSDRVIRKAQEYDRLFQLKSASGSGFHVKGVGHLLLCLDLAAKAENFPIDRDLSVKLSGMKKPLYNSKKQTMMQVLGILQDLSTKDVCVQFGCPEITEEVESLLELYWSQSCKGKSEIKHPGFKAAAIAALCKIRKLGVERSKVFELSALKKSVFDKLVKSMTTLQMQLEKSKEQEKPSRKRPHSLIEAVEAKARTMEEEIRRADAASETQPVDFAAWKRRMLEEAKTNQ